MIKVHLGQRLGSAARQATTTACSSSAWARSSTAQYQKYAVESGAYIREHFFGADPRLLEMVEAPVRRPAARRCASAATIRVKVYTAYKAAVGAQGLADRHPRADDQGLRPRRGRRRQEHHPPAEEAERGGAARVPHALRHSRSPTTRSPTRRSTGRPTTAPRSSTCASGARRSAASCPTRTVARRAAASRRSTTLFEEFFTGTEGRKVSTTMVFVRLLSKLLRDKDIGKLIVPIVPDEARTFGMEALFRAGRHLLARRPALRAGRHGHAALLQGSDGRADSRRRASPRPARCRRSSPPAPPTRPTASTRFRSSSTTRCSASSGSAT